nr:potassium channel family protein [Candidatus Acidoferrales bacterium]
MHIFLGIIGVFLLLVILLDVFETIILPRRITRKLRLARGFYRATWRPWSAVGRMMRATNRRETFLSYYGPLSLLVLFGVWAAGLILAFAILHKAGGSEISISGIPDVPGSHAGFATDIYMSGTTFFTLGLGDVVPRTTYARVIMVFEAGLGFGFLGLGISYLPVLYGAFSRREVNISLLDARAGSPPTASELLKRHTQPQSVEALEAYLKSWESWSAELMESHLSYPVLCYFRSQHNNESWLSAMTTILDVSALLLAYGTGALRWQAKMTFAISRHAIVDLSQVLNCPPLQNIQDRLPDGGCEKMIALMDVAAIPHSMEGCSQMLTELRQMYEPYIASLSQRLMMPVAPWISEKVQKDNWKTTAWGRISADIDGGARAERDDRGHF